MKTRNNEGQMRIIETILAALLIASALFFVTFFAANPRTSAYEVKDLEKMGYSVLHDLDQHGLLNSFVYDNEKLGDFRTALRITLPTDVYFNLTIYKLYDKNLNHVGSIVYGDSATFSDAKNIASVSYSLIGTPELGYEPRLLILQITRG